MYLDMPSPCSFTGCQSVAAIRDFQCCKQPPCFTPITLFLAFLSVFVLQSSKVLICQGCCQGLEAHPACASKGLLAVWIAAHHTAVVDCRCLDLGAFLLFWLRICSCAALRVIFEAAAWYAELVRTTELRDVSFRVAVGRVFQTGQRVIERTGLCVVSRCDGFCSTCNDRHMYFKPVQVGAVILLVRTQNVGTFGNELHGNCLFQ